VQDTAVVTDELATRYGRSRKRTLRQRWWVVGLAAGGLIIFVLWLFWAGLVPQSASPSLVATDGGNSIISKRAISVSFSIETKPGNTVSCALQALDENFAIVGWKIVTYPNVAARVTEHTEIIRTTAQSQTGLISECWLT
jgi:Domain of unknown function (DUF4307)